MKRISAIDVAMKKDSRGCIEGYVSTNDPIQPLWINVSDDEAMKLYTHSEWLFATINRVVDDCVQAEMRIVPKKKDAKITGKIKNHIAVIEEFISDPNNNKESFSDLREKFLRDALIYGRGALEKVKSSNGRLKEVYTLIAKNVRYNSDKHGNLPERRAYVLKPDDTSCTKDTHFDRDEVITLTHIPISKNVYGLKAIDVIANSIASDLLRAAYNSNYFVNGAEASGILSVAGLSRTELKKFREYWESKFKGANKSHRTFITNSDDVKHVRMALTNKDMEFSEYGKEIRNKIFTTYKMQPFVMGIVDETTGKLNSNEQVKIYKQGALKPLLKKEAYQYTKEIIEDGFGFKDIMFAFPSVDQEDAKTDADIDSIDLTNGVIVVNERRNKLGMPEVPWGNTPVNTMPEADR